MAMALTDIILTAVSRLVSSPFFITVVALADRNAKKVADFVATV